MKICHELRGRQRSLDIPTVLPMAANTKVVGYKAIVILVRVGTFPSQITQCF